MPDYKYTAIDRNGAQATGRIDAADDARRFYRTDSGVVLVTAPMLAKWPSMALAKANRSPSASGSHSRAQGRGACRRTASSAS